jgi:hypothetical protein
MKLSYAKLRFREHQKGALNRNIPFLLTFEEWYDWWLLNGVDRNIPRPNNGDTLCMCRKNDQGPYALGNIYCATKKQNTADGHKINPYPNGKKKLIQTPFGTFESKIAAANFLKIDTTTISRRMKRHPTQYYYV